MHFPPAYRRKRFLIEKRWRCRQSDSVSRNAPALMTSRGTKPERICPDQGPIQVHALPRHPSLAARLQSKRTLQTRVLEQGLEGELEGDELRERVAASAGSGRLGESAEIGERTVAAAAGTLSRGKENISSVNCMTQPIESCAWTYALRTAGARRTLSADLNTWKEGKAPRTTRSETGDERLGAFSPVDVPERVDDVIRAPRWLLRVLDARLEYV